MGGTRDNDQAHPPLLSASGIADGCSALLEGKYSGVIDLDA